MSDAINPNYYKDFSNGAQVIDIIENLRSNPSHAVKYLSRGGHAYRKGKGNDLQDLRKARWYVDREIERLEGLENGEESVSSSEPAALNTEAETEYEYSVQYCLILTNKWVYVSLGDEGLEYSASVGDAEWFGDIAEALNFKRNLIAKTRFPSSNVRHRIVRRPLVEVEVVE